MVHVLLIEPCKPEKLTAHKDMVTEDTITLSWKGSDPTILGYEIEYRKPGEGFKKVKNVSNLRYTITELNPYTKYEFRVAAFNSAGLGPFTDIVTQFTSKHSLKIVFVNNFAYVASYKVYVCVGLSI